VIDVDAPGFGLLGAISAPEQIRALSTAELQVLAKELREFLVSSVAVTGGHLGSNLGAVELTIALHRALRSPEDTIVWDTGHQAYVHKLLTGRASRFATLRQPGGLSGYPSRAESAHDLVENSHASTALSYAFGLAAARRLSKDPRRVVAVVGDGSLTGGVALEALNNIGASRARVMIVLNDNGRSYAPTVSALAVSATAPRSFFDSLGIEYVGPVDGHDVPAMDEAFCAAVASPGPVVVHVRTVKGCGYGPAERDDDKCLHDVAPFDPRTGRAWPATARRSHTEAFGTALVEEAAARPELVAITAAMGGPTGLNAFRDRYPDRFFDVGIAEQHAVNAAAGMAMGGLRPVVAIYSTFLNRAWDQIYYDVGLHRLPVVFCLDRAGITGDDGPSHHGVLDMMLLSKVPGMTVLAPSSYEEVGVMLRDALRIDDGPVAIRWPKSEARSVPVVGAGVRARLVRGGREVCFLGVGKLVAACEEAAAVLTDHGIDATVWDARCVAPIDGRMLNDAARHHVIVTAEDAVIDGGFGARVVAALSQRGDSASPRVVTAGVPSTYLPHGKASGILADLGLDGGGLARSALECLRVGRAAASEAGPRGVFGFEARRYPPPGHGDT
jgi:1-deoxy-D-xylulose-5-phosphate synthase